MLNDILLNAADKIFSLPILKAGWDLGLPGGYVFTILPIVCLFIILFRKEHLKKTSLIAYFLYLIISLILIFALTNLTILMNPFFPVHKESGAFLLFLVYLPLITICGLLNWLLSLWLNLSRLTKVLPFLIVVYFIFFIDFYLLRDYIPHYIRNITDTILSYNLFTSALLALITTIVLLIMETKKILRDKSRL